MVSIQAHDVSSLLEPFEALQKKYSLYNVKLVGESAPAMFPEYLKELIQDRGYWSRFLKIKTGLSGKWIAFREQKLHLCFKNKLCAIFIVSPNSLLPFDLDNCSFAGHNTFQEHSSRRWQRI